MGSSLHKTKFLDGQDENDLLGYNGLRARAKNFGFEKTRETLLTLDFSISYYYAH